MKLQQLTRLELINYMEETLEDLCELSKQLGDESIHLKIQLLSKELIELRDFEEDEQNG